jgi:hypothetical protein
LEDVTIEVAEIVHNFIEMKQLHQKIHSIVKCF